MSEKYLQMFDRFFNNVGRMSSTYKPVFLRALLDVGDLHDPAKGKRLIGNQWLEHKNGKLILDLNFIATRFAKYYWDMEYSFRLRQSQDPQDANITRLIKNIHESGEKPPTLEELASETMGHFRKQVINRSIKPEVLVHLLTDMQGLYKKTDSRTIEFDDDVIAFLHTYKILLKRGLTDVLAKYLEKLNRMTPQISNKIDSNDKKRQALNAEIQVSMGKWQDSKCFYCERTLKRTHVDHVIPYNYVFTTDAYNCTLACQQCNCEKSDMLPEKDIFNKVIERNDIINEYLRGLNEQYNRESYERLFDTCVEEYNGDAFFAPSV